MDPRSSIRRKKENIYEQINLALSTKQHARRAEHMVATLEKAYGKSGHRTPKKSNTNYKYYLFSIRTWFGSRSLERSNHYLLVLEDNWFSFKCANSINSQFMSKLSATAR